MHDRFVILGLVIGLLTGLDFFVSRRWTKWVARLAIVTGVLTFAFDFWFEGAPPGPGQLVPIGVYARFSSFVLLILAMVLSFRPRFRHMQVFFALMSFLIVMLSFSSALHPILLIQPGVANEFLLMHLLVLFLAFACFCSSFLCSCLFLWTERAIKARAVSPRLSRLPSLESLDLFHMMMLVAGYLLFSLVILTGAGFSKLTTGHYLQGTIKEGLSLATWVVLALLILLRQQQGWQGQKGIRLSLAAQIALFAVYAVGFM